LADALMLSFQRTRQPAPYKTDAGPAIRITSSSAGSAPPQSYGALPVAADPRAPAGVIVPLGGDDALWLGLLAVDELRPVAVRAAALTPARIDAISGTLWKETLERAPQNYVVCPPQSALDGIQHGATRALQFARTAQAPGAVSCERLEVIVLPADRAWSLPPAPQPPITRPLAAPTDEQAQPDEEERDAIGVRQIVIADPFGPDTWTAPACAVSIALVTPEIFSELTGAPLLLPRNEADLYGGWRLP
jgi:hypothetical protein